MSSPSSIIKADLDCPICHGEGFVVFSEGKSTKATRCDCVEKKLILSYLEPYSLAKGGRIGNLTPYLNKNLFFQTFEEISFKRFARGFLLGAYALHQPRHLTLTPFIIADATYAVYGAEGHQNQYSLNELREIDLFIILLLGNDPPNKEYSSIVSSLTSERDRHHKISWVYSKYDLHSDRFSSLYGAALATHLEDSGIFHLVNLGSKKAVRSTKEVASA